MMELDEAFAYIDSLNLKSEPIVPSEMTLEDIARLRFTFVSPEDEEAIELELKNVVLDMDMS
ncbi:hypothetical protein [Granulicatella seriolae]|uniref:Uncharacterized protein n=1 Tax=Granulicatella seriolae TaxID=2967226 RepID=A0ABT1WPV6_9LACT|nr:hypothetical protein [Granulicatella seriolae]